MSRSVYVGLSLLVAVGVIVVLSLNTSLQSQPPMDMNPNNVRDFMRDKLKHSQQILAGLTTEDYDKIAKGAQELSLLSHAASWQVLQTEEYVQHSIEFRRSSNTLRDVGKNKNLDAAALAYVDMTMKCINCHKYVRGVRMASIPVK